VVVADRIRRATAERRALVLDGVTMGGGPSHWATMDHVRAGLPAYATPEAARTFDDDLEAMAEMGIRVVAEDEALGLADGGALFLSLRDLWFGPLIQTLAAFGVDLRLSALAVAVFDHGAAPPGFSDRVFRFNYLRERLVASAAAGLKPGLAGFAFPRQTIPPAMTRLRAVDQTAPNDLPLLVMDTAPAAVLGALEDPAVAGCSDEVVANIGNFHCLAFHLRDGQVAGLFEHHTGELSPERLRRYIEQLEAGTISNAEVYADNGHGALVMGEPAEPARFVAVTGPRRALLTASGLDTYLAVPHGDMMLTGNFGLLRAFAAYDEPIRAAVEHRLGPPRRPEPGGLRQAPNAAEMA
jgi:uncharacterized protein (DUF1786 family)